MFRFILVLNSSPLHVSYITVFLSKGKRAVLDIYCTSSKKKTINSVKSAKKIEETAFQRSCRYMATHRYNLSAVRIDLNALDLQRREAGNELVVKDYLYLAIHACLQLWYNTQLLSMLKVLKWTNKYGGLFHVNTALNEESNKYYSNFN